MDEFASLHKCLVRRCRIEGPDVQHRSAVDFMSFYQYRQDRSFCGFPVPGKEMKTLCLVVGLMLSGCSGNTVQAPMGSLTSGEHEALAGRFDRSAKDARNKLENYQKLLMAYQADVDDGKDPFEWTDHYRLMSAHYQKVADVNSRLADAHREMAVILRNMPYATGTGAVSSQAEPGQPR